MPSFISKSKLQLDFCLLLVLVILTVNGCNEDPQRAADKKAKEAVERALNEYSSSRDFDKAQKVLRQSLGAAPNSAKQELVLLTQGSLEYGKAVSMRNELAPTSASIQQNLEELSGLMAQITKTQSEKIEIESVLRSRSEEKRSLEAQLNGDANGPGLLSKQKNAEDQLAKLKAKRDELSRSLSENLKQASDIQHQADELLSQADSARGTQKADLQKKAYDILQGKNTYQIRAQELQDQINIIQSEFAVIEPTVTFLNANIDQVRKRIDELDKSELAAKSNQRLADIGTMGTKFQEEFSGTLAQIEQTQSQLASKVKDVTQLLATAQNDFKKITSQEALKDFGRVAAAEAISAEGSVHSNYALFQRLLAARLTILASGEVTESQAQLKTLAQRYLDDADEYVSKAISDYNDAFNLYGKIAIKKDDFSTAVLKNQILVLAQKAYLAERIENIDIKTQAIEQSKDLIGKAIKNDPAFESSLSESPYNVLTGKKPVQPAAAMKKAPQQVTEPNATESADESIAESNQPVQEPNEQQ